MEITTEKQPKRFSDFGIKPESKAFIGPSIEIQDIINQEIEVLDFRIEPSKHPKKEGDECLYLQIRYEGQLRVVFSGSVYLQQMIRKVPREGGFPFLVTIIKEKETKRLLFKQD